MQVGATAYNDQSSRSHTLCRFLVESAPAGNSNAINTVSTTGSGVGAGGAVTRTSAWLTLVDLAGALYCLAGIGHVVSAIIE